MEPKMGRKLKMGMVGGGKDAFIGGVHRTAAIMDGTTEFAAGALSSTPEKAKESGRALALPDDRNYGSWEEMIERELARPAGDRIDFVSIVTPNHMHFPVAKAFVEAGFNVVLDKPMVQTGEQAAELIKAVDKSDAVFAVTYNYGGYPMIKQARALVREGRLGKIRKVIVEYSQGWLARKIEDEGAKQAEWRTDPARSGIAGAIGDIGSHAENLAHAVTGLDITDICADLTTFVPGRRLDDDGNLLLRFENDARGILIASQISAGEENNLRLRVYGSEAGLEWHQENPNYLYFRPLDAPEQVFKRGNPYVADDASRLTRTPFGHPEAFFEAFANIYRNVTDTIRARSDGRQPTDQELDFPTVRDGARGVHFIEKTVESSRSEKKWLPARWSEPAAGKGTDKKDHG
ncbi:Gfo/Idh/MocA family oxidoreductase [Fodinicurvata sp. EGI_FJ10296]|uniref:Gfo/Idh/MocA family protein n=1 Tax=Fodinicurvata sp. EGI_FJ10296 TaxID=3231908 RepID=UPI0034538ABC